MSSAKRRLRLFGITFSVVVFLVLALFAWGWSRWRASLPTIDGRASLPGLSAAVSVERDALGVPTVHAASRLDASRALGYVHAQDRFFQMDLSRRRAAGELAELFGEIALPLDRGARLHEFRPLAQKVVASLPAAERQQIDAYVAGVNAGLAAFSGKPWEYQVLREKPQPWRPEDTVLCIYAMALDLQEEEGAYERTLMTVREVLGPGALAFFAPLVGPADAALDGSTAPLPAPPSERVINLRAKRTADKPNGSVHDDVGGRRSVGSLATPDGSLEGPGLSGPRGRALNKNAGTSSFFDDANPQSRPRGTGALQRPRFGDNPGTVALQPSPLAHSDPDDPEFRPGSNSFGLAGHLAGGGALLENDMHLGLAVPPVWYRARLIWKDGGAQGGDITGVTLPGAPAIVVGSNGSVAWGFTNSYVDSGDLVVVQPDTERPEGLYLLGNRLADFETRTQTINIKGKPSETFTTRWTTWGPIVGETSSSKRPLAFKWTMHDPAAANLGLMQLETARTVDDAIAIAHRAGIPAQNFLVADRAGALAWTIAGRLPERVGHTGRLPISWAFGDRDWKGLLPPENVPVRRASDSPDGFLWTANQRMLGGEALSKLGDGGYDPGGRAAQIHARVAELARHAVTQPAVPRDLLDIALDDRSLFLNRWHQRLLDVLTPDAVSRNPQRAEFRKQLETWAGRATVTSVSYRLVRAWRQRVASRVMDPIFSSCVEAWSGFSFRMLAYEQPLWAVLEQRPLHLLAASYATWDDLLLAAVDDVIAALDKQGVPLAQATWGQQNRLRMRHPFSSALPSWLRQYIDMPAQPLPGDNHMPRVQTTTDGASERMVVSPGRESEGIFHMPGGQSGHPLSPYYRAGHDAWVRGEATPFLPGKRTHVLLLAPQTSEVK